MKKNTIFVAILVFIIITAYSLFVVSKSRSFQFFGGITQRVNTDEKIVALTFDDAPSKETREILKELEKLGIKATFFAVGEAVNEFPNETRQIAKAGHELGNHSYTHQRMVLKTPSFIKEEIEKTDSLIRSASYEGEIFFRPPNGKKLFLLPLYLKQHDRKTIMWDVEPETYLAQDADPKEIVEYTVSHTKPGSIILLHPFYNENARKAIPEVVSSLENRGYRFVTVSELLSKEK